MADQPESNVHELLSALMKPFPAQAIKQRQGGGNQMLSYVETETVIRRLNATVGTWDFRITEIKVIEQLVVVWGEMTIPGLGTRAGTGVQVLRGGEDMWKGAASDCLKKCATLFGVAIELYGPDLEAGEIAPNVGGPYDAPDAPQRARGTSANVVPMARAGVPPTPMQFKKVGALANSLGMSDDDLHDFAGVPTLHDLDRQGVSQLIERLIDLEASGAERQREMPSGPVGWTEFWKEVVAAGYARDKAVIEGFIGPLGADPADSLARFQSFVSGLSQQQVAMR